MDLVPGVSSAGFRVTHALSHHLVTNLPADYEASFYGKIFELNVRTDVMET